MTKQLPDHLDGLVHGYGESLRGQFGRTERTVQIYTDDLRPFLRFLIMENLDPRQLDRRSLRRYLAWLSTEARGRAGGYARVSVARKLVVLRSFYRHLLQEGHITANPIPKGRTFNIKVEKRLPVFLGREEIARLLEAPDPSGPIGIRDRAILELFYSSGVRLAELQRLSMDDISLGSREVRVRGKGSKERMVFLGGPAAQSISNYLAAARPPLEQAGLQDPRRVRTTALFLNRYGSELSCRSIEKLVGKYSALATTRPGVHPHTLRHTFATHLMEGGANMRVVQDLLGHASPATTQVYTHVTQNETRAEYLTTHPRARKKLEKDALMKDQND